MTMLDTALSYAWRGWPVFPLAPLSKVPPKGTHGRLEATTDPNVITALWGDISVDPITEVIYSPNMNIGIDTDGAGLVVIDIDIKGNADGLESWDKLLWENNVHNEPKTYTVSTPSGGIHYYFRANDALDCKTVSGVLAEGIDVRAKNGSIVASGSKTEQGDYRIINDVPPRPLPSWLRFALRKAGVASSETERVWKRPPPPPIKVNGAYVAAGVERELGRIRGGGKGDRTMRVNNAALALSRFVRSGELNEDAINDQLVEAAMSIGMSERDARYHVKKGLES